MSEIPYSDVKGILEQKFNTTEQEIVRWILDKEITPKDMWVFTNVGGKKKEVPHWNIENYEHDGTMHLLQRLDFNADEINNFVPKVRWLTFYQVMERWPESGEDIKSRQKQVAEKLRKQLPAPTSDEIDEGKNLNLYVYPLDVIESILPLPKQLRDIQKPLSEQQAETVGNDGADSQAVTEPASTKVIQPNSNDIEYSGLLNIPSKIDSWFQVIDDMTRAFYRQYTKIPNETQAWGQLWETPPEGYKITTGTDKGEDCLNMPGVSNLSKSAFSKRWAKYTADKPR